MPDAQNLREWTEQWDFTTAGAVMILLAEEGIASNYRDDVFKRVTDRRARKKARPDSR